MRAADLILLCTFLPSCKAFVQSHYLEVPSSAAFYTHKSQNKRKINPRSFSLGCQPDPKDGETVNYGLEVTSREIFL